VPDVVVFGSRYKFETGSLKAEKISWVSVLNLVVIFSWLCAFLSLPARLAYRSRPAHDRFIAEWKFLDKNSGRGARQVFSVCERVAIGANALLALAFLTARWRSPCLAGREKRAARTGAFSGVAAAVTSCGRAGLRGENRRKPWGLERDQEKWSSGFPAKSRGPAKN